MTLLQKTADVMSTTDEVAGNQGSYGSGYVQLDLAGALSAIHDTAYLTMIGIPLAIS